MFLEANPRKSSGSAQNVVTSGKIQSITEAVAEGVVNVKRQIDLHMWFCHETARKRFSLDQKPERLGLLSPS